MSVGLGFFLTLSLIPKQHVKKGGLGGGGVGVCGMRWVG